MFKRFDEVVCRIWSGMEWLELKGLVMCSDDEATTVKLHEPLDGVYGHTFDNSYVRGVV